MTTITKVKTGVKIKNTVNGIEHYLKYEPESVGLLGSVGMKNVNDSTTATSFDIYKNSPADKYFLLGVPGTTAVVRWNGTSFSSVDLLSITDNTLCYFYVNSQTPGKLIAVTRLHATGTAKYVIIVNSVTALLANMVKAVDNATALTDKDTAIINVSEVGGFDYIAPSVTTTSTTRTADDGSGTTTTRTADDGSGTTTIGYQTIISNNQLFKQNVFVVKNEDGTLLTKENGLYEFTTSTFKAGKYNIYNFNSGKIVVDNDNIIIGTTGQTALRSDYAPDTSAYSFVAPYATIPHANGNINLGFEIQLVSQNVVIKHRRKDWTYGYVTVTDTTVPAESSYNQVSGFDLYKTLDTDEYIFYNPALNGFLASNSVGNISIRTGNVSSKDLVSFTTTNGYLLHKGKYVSLNGQNALYLNSNTTNAIDISGSMTSGSLDLPIYTSATLQRTLPTELTNYTFSGTNKCSGTRLGNEITVVPDDVEDARQKCANVCEETLGCAYMSLNGNTCSMYTTVECATPIEAPELQLYKHNNAQGKDLALVLAENTSLKDQLTTINGAYADMTGTLQTARDDLKAARDALAAEELLLKNATIALGESNADIEAAQLALDLKQAELDGIEMQINAAQVTIEDAATDLGKKSGQLELTEQQLNDAIVGIDDTNAELKLVTDNLSAATGDIESLRKSLEDVTGELTDTKQQLKDSTAAANTASSNLDTATEEYGVFSGFLDFISNFTDSITGIFE